MFKNTNINNKEPIKEMTEVVKRSAPPPAKVNYNEEKKVLTATTAKDLNLRKTPTIAKKDQGSKKTDETWKILNSSIKNQEPHNPWECVRGNS